MRTSSSPSLDHGLTRLEVVAVLGILALFLFLVVPPWRAARAMADGIRCANNLKYVGLALRIFANDHDGQLPWQVPAHDGGMADLGGSPESLWRYFLVLTNAEMRGNNLDYPKFLWCPLDSAKHPAGTFYANPANPRSSVFSGNQHVSYFLNLGPSTNELQAETPDRIQSGDRNLLVDGKAIGPGAAYLSGGQSVGFTSGKIHRGYGHLLFADGSVQEVWSNWIVGAQSATNLLIVP